MIGVFSSPSAEILVQVGTLVVGRSISFIG